MEKIKNQKGITLVALVVTIIILILLAGVSINLVLGDKGIFNKAKQATEKYEIAQERESLEVEIADIYTEIIENENKIATLQDLYLKLNKDKYEIELDDEKNPTIASIKVIKGKYSFKVNSKFEIISEERKEENLKELIFDFKNNKNDFEDTLGSCVVDENGIRPNTFESISGDTWKYANTKTKKDINMNLYSKFEITSDILLEDNNANYKMGGIQINFYNGENVMLTISLIDFWEANQWIKTYIATGTLTEIYNNKTSKVQASGEYKIVSDGNKIKALFNDTALGEIDYTEIPRFDSIEIKFYEYPAHGMPTVGLKKLSIKTEP